MNDYNLDDENASYDFNDPYILNNDIGDSEYIPRDVSLVGIYTGLNEAGLYEETRDWMIIRVEQAKTEKPGICPVCGEAFENKSGKKVFCSTKGARNCADRFRNFKDAKRMQYHTRLRQAGKI